MRNIKIAERSKTIIVNQETLEAADEVFRRRRRCKRGGLRHKGHRGGEESSAIDKRIYYETLDIAH